MEADTEGKMLTAYENKSLLSAVTANVDNIVAQGAWLDQATVSIIRGTAGLVIRVASIAP
jgi:hypothetical protein